MPVITAEAKLYQSIRCLVVDKNISAALTASFSLGNQRQPSPVIVDGVPTVFANVLGTRTQFAVCDVFSSASISLTPQRITNQGGGNGVFSGGFVTGQQYVITTVGTTDWNTIGGTGTYAVGTVFTAEQPGTAGTNGAGTTTGRAQLYSWLTKSSLRCVFPTYVRIDIEKLMDMGLPEGQDCLVQLEEGFLLQDRGATKQASPFFEFANNLQDTPTPRNDNYVSFRTPKRFKLALNSLFSLTNIVRFRLRFYTQVLALQNAFSPVMTAQVTRSGTDDMQSAFTLNAIIGKLKFFAVAAVSTFEPNEPGGQSFLLGNGYEFSPGDPSAYLNPPPPWTFPGFLRIRNGGTSAMPATTTLTASGVNLPFIVPAVNYTSTFTITPNVDAFKGAGLPLIASAGSMTVSSRVDYNSTVPTMQSTATILCRPIQNGKANIVSQSSFTANAVSTTALLLKIVVPAGGVGPRTFALDFTGNVLVNIDWGDNTFDNNISTAGTKLHTYGTAGTYFIAIDRISAEGIPLEGWKVRPGENRVLNGQSIRMDPQNMIRECISFGKLNTEDLFETFQYCINLTKVPTFLPSSVNNISRIFKQANTFNDSSLTFWNTANVTNMSEAFSETYAFNQNIGSWNTGNVTSMYRMFWDVPAFNQNISNWDTGSVTNMIQMFYAATAFNQDLSGWCVTLIPTAPSDFATATTAWNKTNRIPVWGTCP